jgi:Fe-S-cluster formation regulator IscX/YfhJ
MNINKNVKFAQAIGKQQDTRYEKLDPRYMAFLHLVCTFVWLT